MTNLVLKPSGSLAAALLLFSVFSVPSAGAATIWNGPNITWTKSSSTPSDTIVPGKVVLTRGTRDVLYNTAANELRAGSVSPKDTMWAFGDLANATTLTYSTLESLRNGNLAARILNKPMVVHLVAEDIYLSITFKTWGQHGSGTVSYTRSTAPAAVPPAVSITAPAEGTVFAAPAAFDLTANATVTGGTVTNVEYFSNGVSLGSAAASPFRVTANLAAAGNYTLTAVATANGVTATSAPVHVNVVAPAPLSLTSPALNNGQFSFSYNTDPGLTYIVQAASSLTPSGTFDWSTVATNAASAESSAYSENLTASTFKFFRVRRLSTP